MAKKNNVPNSPVGGMPASGAPMNGMPASGMPSGGMSANGMPAGGAPMGMPQNPAARVPYQNAVVPVTSMVPVSQPYTVPQTEKKKSTAGYRVFALLFALLSIGGLFLGMLGKFVPLLGHRVAFDGSVLGGSILGYLIEFFKGIKTFFPNLIEGFKGGMESMMSTLLQLPLLLVVFFIAFCTVLSLLMGIIGVASGKASKRCMHSNGALLLLSYGGLAMYVFTATMTGNADLSGKELILASLDLPSLIVAGVALLVLFVTTLAERKAGGLFNILLTLLSLATIVIFTLPVCALGSAPISILVSEISKSSPNVKSVIFPLIALAITEIMIVVSFIATCSRVCAKRGYARDAVRFGLLLIGFVLLIVAASVGANKVNLFSGGALAIVFTILPPALTLLAFVFAVLAAVVAARAKKKQKESVQNAQPQQQMPPPYGYRPPMPNGQQPPQGYRSPVPPPAGANMPPRAIPPTAGASANGYRPPMPNGYPQRPTGPASPIPPMGARPMGPTSPLRPTMPQGAMPQQGGKPMTDFEKRMAAIAKGEQDAPAQSYPAQPAGQYKPAPQRQIPPAIPASEKVENSIYNPSKYAYDPFVYTLTATEMNEFGDLFIANKYGLQAYLPPYAIGGDNRDFFNKVFIYLGRFRANISDALLNKLYRYVCGMQ